eukprot:5707151-Pleurochrysis_carterae.AAC.1
MTAEMDRKMWALMVAVCGVAVLHVFSVCSSSHRGRSHPRARTRAFRGMLNSANKPAARLGQTESAGKGYRSNIRRSYICTSRIVRERREGREKGREGGRKIEREGERKAERKRVRKGRREGE